MTNKTGVYSITNTVNGKRYVGSAGLSFQSRWRTHRGLLRRGRHKNPHLQSAWTRYGESAFLFRVILVCSPKDVTWYEQLVIDGWQTADRKYGYNMNPVAGSRLGTKLTSEQREKHSKALTGRIMSEETKAKIAASHIGKTHSVETKAKISAIQRGKTISAETRKKMSVSMKGLKRQPFTAEHRGKIAAANQGRKHAPFTDQHKANISAGKLGHTVSAESKQKMRESAIRAWKRRHELGTDRASDATKRKLRDKEQRRREARAANGKAANRIEEK